MPPVSFGWQLAKNICNFCTLPSWIQAYWRIAGMSYLKYANMCAEVVRGSLKEPYLLKVC